MQISWDDPLLKILLRKIYAERGMDLRGYRPKFLARRVSSRLNVRKVDSIPVYMRMLDREPDEYKRLLDSVSINVSRFFRDADVWGAVEEKVVPAIIDRKKKRHQRMIRCWSAGASHGEEAYSLSILFQEILDRSAADLSIRVYGTDIDEDGLRKARLAEYTPEFMREITPGRLSKYFTFTGASYILADAIRMITGFQHHNIVTDVPLRHIDLILCRNVLIYFSRELQGVIYNKFHQALNPGGFLILGKVETLWGGIKNSFATIDNKERIYQKAG